ncbi:hypothetical protein MEO94_31415, partial [Dolichospermum sp. ST_sed9]|nr:hypothetical protein [Dolichospermum sp. ST_sed9]
KERLLICGYEKWLEVRIIGLTHGSRNNEPLQAQRTRRNEGLRNILGKSWINEADDCRGI